MELKDEAQSTIKALRKQVRILEKRLERSEADRQQLENANEQREAFLKALVRELEKSKQALEQKSTELIATLETVNALQIKLIESEKISALGVLVAGIAHEINNPVNFIYGNLEPAVAYINDLTRLLQCYEQHYPTAPPQIQSIQQDIDLDFIKQDLPELLGSMQSGAERICSIVKSLRTFSRLDEADFKSVDIHQGIDSTLMLLEHRIKSHPDDDTITIIKSYQSLPPVECFAGALNQVFMHILSNAIDAVELIKKDEAGRSESPKTIKISTFQPNKRVISISIENNGPAILPEIKGKVFDPFFTTKPVGQGTGLGLSVSYQVIVNQHGGTLTCETTSEQGTNFIITLPLQGNTADMPEAWD